MKQPTLSNHVLYLLSISAGLVVANLYYNQPLLHQIAVSFNVSEAKVSNVALFTQLGYALGLLFIIPLGDKISNKKILRIDFLIMILALLAAGFANSLLMLLISSFLVGFTSALPQLFVPMAAQLSDDKNRGRTIGIVMSGLLIGILGSRVISGFVGERFGWRVMFYAAAFLMVVLFLILKYKLPTINPVFKGTYGSLMKSLYHYFKTDASLRLATLRGGLAFAGLSAFWTTLVFLLEDSFGYGSTIAGAFGILGIVGALGATVIGKISTNISSHSILVVGTVLLILSWVILFFSTHSLIGLMLGVIVVDLGMQSVHITNQKIIFSNAPEARNRVNTIYMVGFFIGGALGTVLGALAWANYQWSGVATLGITLSSILLIIHFIFRKK
jgi:predicted MFS family arabinose efflux permease